MLAASTGDRTRTSDSATSWFAAAEALNERDWEWVVVDWLKTQGAHVDERHVGKNQPIIDAEARFDHGELGEDLWRVQVKRLNSEQDLLITRDGLLFSTS